MNTSQIDRVLKRHLIYFQGVYPIDLLPSAFSKPAIFVVNLKHYLPGSHWIALCFSDSGYAEFFDSYDLPSIHYEVIQFSERHCTHWDYNRHRIQGVTSDVCGHHCCIFSHHSDQGRPMTSFVKQF
jgi:hypothetical protein